MRVMLYVLAALTFGAGTQLVVLADHTDLFFAWTIATPASAAFVGAGFWAASAAVFWCARQRDWARARMIVPTIAVVATMLLVATLEHLDLFHGPIGLAWIEVYAFFPPLFGALVVMQLAVPGADRRRSLAGRLPRLVRIALSVEAVVSIGVGVALFAAAGAGPDWWPWALTDLTSKAIGTWLIGIGLTAGVVAVLDDRALLGGWSVGQMVLGAGALLCAARFAADLDADAASVAFVAWYAATLLMGAVSSAVAWQADAFAATRPAGGIPVELRPAEPGQPSSLAIAETIRSSTFFAQ